MHTNPYMCHVYVHWRTVVVGIFSLFFFCLKPILYINSRSIFEIYWNQALFVFRDFFLYFVVVVVVAVHSLFRCACLNVVIRVVRFFCSVCFVSTFYNVIYIFSPFTCSLCCYCFRLHNLYYFHGYWFRNVVYECVLCTSVFVCFFHCF